MVNSFTVSKSTISVFKPYPKRLNVDYNLFKCPIGAVFSNALDFSFQIEYCMHACKGSLAIFGNKLNLLLQK